MDSIWIEMEWHKLIFYIGGYSALILGLSSWIGSIISKKIYLRDSHELAKRIEKLKNDLEISSHEKKLSISRYDELSANALQGIHERIVDLEFFLDDQLNNILIKWNEAFKSSQEALSENQPNMSLVDSDEDLRQTQKELQEEQLQLKSQLALAVGILKFIAYESFSEWQPKFRELKEFILKKEIYIDEKVFNELIFLVKALEERLSLSVKSISKLVLVAIKQGGVIEKKTGLKIKISFDKLQKDIWESFKPVKVRITQNIKKHLDPKLSKNESQ